MRDHIASRHAFDPQFEIANEDHLPFWMPECPSHLGIFEPMQQAMQSVSVTMDITDEIVSLVSH